MGSKVSVEDIAKLRGEKATEDDEQKGPEGEGVTSAKPPEADTEATDSEEAAKHPGTISLKGPKGATCVVVSKRYMPQRDGCFYVLPADVSVLKRRYGFKEA